MGTWERTAPTLPEGSEWSDYTSTVSYGANHFKNILAIRIARLQGNKIVVDARLQQTVGDYGDFYSPGTMEFTPYVNNVAETVYTSASSQSTRHFYYTTDAAENDELKIKAQVQGSSVSAINRTITAPEPVVTIPVISSITVLDGTTYNFKDAEAIRTTELEGYATKEDVEEMAEIAVEDFATKSWVQENFVNVTEYAPVDKTDEMTQKVGRDTDGTLWTVPGKREEIIDNNPWVTLWENDNPTVAFTPQTVSLDLSGYDTFFLTFRHTNTGETIIPVVARKWARDAYAWGVVNVNASAAILVHTRQFNISNSGVQFYDGYRKSTTSTSAGTKSNTSCVPVGVYAMKL